MLRTVWLALALCLVGSVAEDEAFAKKPKGEVAEAEADAGGKKDPYEVPEMKPTKIAEFDAVFDRGRAPLESLATSRKRIDMAKARINTAVGLAEDASFKSACEELQRKVEGKTRVALRKRKIPSLTLADAVPDDVQAMVDQFNAGLDEIDAAVTQLESVKGELATLATETAELPAKAADAAKSAGLGPTEIPAAIKNTGSNTKTLATAKDESEALFTSVEALGTDMIAVWGEAASE